MNEFSYLLSGITISNTRAFTDKWCLDLGAGNLFKMGFGASFYFKLPKIFNKKNLNRNHFYLLLAKQSAKQAREILSLCVIHL